MFGHLGIYLPLEADLLIPVGAVLGWWFAFTRDIRRERTFTIDDIPSIGGRPCGGGQAGLTPAPPVTPKAVQVSPGQDHGGNGATSD